MTEETENYGAVLVDTSMFDGNALKLEKGLLGKLRQFRASEITYLLPDVIRNEVTSHLINKMRGSRNTLEKALREADELLFFEGSELIDSRQEIPIGNEGIEGLAEKRVEDFIASTGALVLESGHYVTISDVLGKYFSSSPPFSEAGKKKNEFPDAIVLMAVEAWATENNVSSILAISRDGDWEKFCNHSPILVYQDDFTKGLAHFNSTYESYKFLEGLEQSLDEGIADDFLGSIESELGSILNGSTPGQRADSQFDWESEGCSAWLEGFKLVSNKLRVIDKGEGVFVLEALANLSIGAEGEFSLSIYDSIDGDNIYVGSSAKEVTDEFETEILITISGNFSDPLEELIVEEVELVNSLIMVNFGTLELDFSETDPF